MAKMGKLTPEELARNKMLMRERDRDRKRLKRMNPEYRKAEQERDRDRKKARRSNEAFRQLEKLRDKIRKERKKGNIIDGAALTAELVNSLPLVPVKTEIKTEQLLVNTTSSGGGGELTTQSQQSPLTQNDRSNIIHNNITNHMNVVSSNNNNTNNNNISNDNDNSPHSSNNTNTNRITTNIVNTPLALTSTSSSGGGGGNNGNNNHNHPLVQLPLGPAAHGMSQLNKGLLYPPPSFAHHPLPIPSVALMPQLCHPMLHQNLGAALYPPNGIKQEYNSDLTPPTSSPNSGGGGGGPNSNGMQVSAGSAGSGNVCDNRSNVNNSADEPEIPLIEPEIILQTSTDIIAAPHHFHNQTAAAHLHQQQCNMFQHMANQQTHHMRSFHLPVGGTAQQPTTAHMQHQHAQLQQHYAAVKAAYISK